MAIESIKANVALAAVATIAFAAAAWGAQPHRHAIDPKPYAGQQARPISSLSDADIADLLAGKGWGLAKPAELNGYPGPAHVLELAEKLALTSDQRTRVEAAFQSMQASAKAVGAQYVEAERALDGAFKEGRAQAELATRLSEAERLRAQLRQIHLAAHLEITPLLTTEQRQKYQHLRGYGTDSHKHHGQH